MKEKVSISLTPEQLRLLDAAAEREGRSRSDLLGRLIASSYGASPKQANLPGETVVDDIPPELAQGIVDTARAEGPDGLCRHYRSRNGLCLDCKASKDADGEWRQP